MENRIGTINKMRTQAQTLVPVSASAETSEPAGSGPKQILSKVHYALPLGDGQVELTPLIGSPIRFRFTGRIFCIHCGKATKTSFSQGYCFRCMQTLAQTDMCIVRPETCHHHLGTCREPEWGTAHCFIEHTVYLANSSGIKVGITRSHQVKTRWMDQGAIQALPIVRVKTRLESGQVESQLSKVLPDKTNWRVMLKSEGEVIDLKAKRDEVFAAWPEGLPGERLTDAEEYRFQYPVLTYPAKPASLNLDKDPQVQGDLLGIKGQYLLLSTGVINMRKYAGYELEWESELAAATSDVATTALAVETAVVAESPAPLKTAAGAPTSQTSLL